MANIIKFCTCGYPENNHNFRHLPNLIDVEVTEDKIGEIYTLEANDFPVKIITTKCIFPQCGADKILHGTIINHEFKGETYESRTIYFQVPKTAKCRSLNCGITLEKHNSLMHIMVCKIIVKNKKERDVLNILTETGCIIYNEN